MTQKGNVIEIKSKCIRLCFKCSQIHSGTQQEGIHYWLETKIWRQTCYGHCRIVRVPGTVTRDWPVYNHGICRNIIINNRCGWKNLAGSPNPQFFRLGINLKWNVDSGDLPNHVVFPILRSGLVTMLCIWNCTSKLTKTYLFIFVTGHISIIMWLLVTFTKKSRECHNVMLLPHTTNIYK